MLYDAGLDRINHNLNSSRAYYSHICSTHTFDQRVENIHMLQKIDLKSAVAESSVWARAKKMW